MNFDILNSESIDAYTDLQGILKRSKNRTF
jgi:hypothetical protein